MKTNLPLSGGEIKYTRKKWGDPKVGIKNNNCYAYAVNDYETYRSRKSSPGNRTGEYLTKIDCKELVKKVLSDNPKKIYIEKPEKKCKKSHYKIMLFASKCKPRNGFNCSEDFHFYKQHGIVEYKVKEGDTVTKISKFLEISPEKIKPQTPLKKGKILTFKKNLFSHKRGWATGPLLTDSKGKIIKDPRRAGKKYDTLHYDTLCSSFCVKNRGIKVGNSHPKIRKNTI